MSSRGKRVRRTKYNPQYSVVAGDFHYPYQSESCIYLFLSFLRWLKPNRVFLNGDIIDFYALSRYNKDPKRMLGLQHEIDQTRGFLSSIRMISDDMEIIYLEGNHESRLRRWLQVHPEISSLRSLTLETMLGFDEFSIEFYPLEDHFDLYPGFIVHHGDLIRSASSLTARAMMGKWHGSGISNHTHRFGAYWESGLNWDERWYENGCMCSLEPDYLIGVPDWQQGFSVISFTGVGVLNVEQVKIKNHEMGFRDQVFRVGY